MRIAIIKSEFNLEVTDGLLAGAIAELKDGSYVFESEDLYSAPGAFEIPVIAKKLTELNMYDGLICLGCVIKGDTAHFEYISQVAANGISKVSIDAGIPIGFGILTTYSDEQAILRSQPNQENKGREAASAVLKTLITFDTILGKESKRDKHSRNTETSSRI